MSDQTTSRSSPFQQGQQQQSNYTLNLSSFLPNHLYQTASQFFNPHNTSCPVFPGSPIPTAQSPVPYALPSAATAAAQYVQDQQQSHQSGELDGGELRRDSRSEHTTHPRHEQVEKTSSSKKRKYQCDHCDYRAMQKMTLTAHINVKHLGIKKFACGVCDYRASHSGNLKYHMKSVHEGVRDFECDQCDHKTFSKANLNNHIKQVHERKSRKKGVPGNSKPPSESF